MSDVATSSPREPSTSALTAAASVAGRVSDRSLQLRRAFVVSADEHQPPPMTTMLRGGRGGEVRFKLYLSLLWFAANPPHDATYPARAWAQLLGLSDPEGAGARRISDALAWLRRHHFVETQVRPGLPSRVVLLDELGEGRAYSVPGAVWRTLNNRQASDLERQRERYLQLPPTFWTRGWMSILDGAAVAMLLVLIAESGGPVADDRRRSRRSSGVWFSPAQADRRYALSAGTRSKGLAQLTGAGLVSVERIAVGDDPFDLRRTRNSYTLNLTRISEPARL